MDPRISHIFSGPYTREYIYQPTTYTYISQRLIYGPENIAPAPCVAHAPPSVDVQTREFSKSHSLRSHSLRSHPRLLEEPLSGLRALRSMRCGREHVQSGTHIGREARTARRSSMLSPTTSNHSAASITSLPPWHDSALGHGETVPPARRAAAGWCDDSMF